MTGAFTVRVEGAVLSGEARERSPASTPPSTPVVFLHGFGGSMQDWDRLLAELPPEFPTLHYDLRGFGASRANEGIGFSHSEDLLALLDALRIARADIVGVSMGGAAALNFALNHPSRVNRLVLISPLIMGWDWSDEWKRLWHGLTDAARSGDMELARRRWWEHPLFATTRASDAAEDLRRSIAEYSGRQWIRDDQRDELPEIERLHLLQAPTLLLTGQLDMDDFRLIADVLAASVPDIRRIDYPGAGHLLHLERQREAARAITQFITDPMQAFRSGAGPG